MTLTLRLDPEVEQRYQALAENTGRTKSYYARQALEEAIARLEWEYGILKTSEEIRAGKQRTYSTEEVLAMLEESDVES